MSTHSRIYVHTFQKITQNITTNTTTISCDFELKKKKNRDTFVYVGVNLLATS